MLKINFNLSIKNYKIVKIILLTKVLMGFHAPIIQHKIYIAVKMSTSSHLRQNLFYYVSPPFGYKVVLPSFRRNGFQNDNDIWFATRIIFSLSLFSLSLSLSYPNDPLRVLLALPTTLWWYSSWVSLRSISLEVMGY